MHMMPEQKRRKHKQSMYISAELIEQILLNLPIKSLFRFSAVSKSWNSMIFGREFAKIYCGREMLVMMRHGISMERQVYPLSSISLFADRSTPFLHPFKCDASCGELWCVEFENSLILHNPTTHKYRKLPIPSARVPIGSTTTVDGSSTSVFVYGLGYDSIGDDYKILKIHRTLDVETELYSLKTDSWTKVKSPSKRQYNWEFSSGKCVFASGALHWPIRFNWNNNGKGLKGPGVISFDLNTHKYRGLKPIKNIFIPNTDTYCCRKKMDMGFGSVGKLRVWLDLCSGMFNSCRRG